METVRGKRRKAIGAGQGKLGHGSACHQGKRALYHCNYCQKDISSCPRIKCAICPDFDLCLECFAVGCEITPHKRDHDYRVVDNLSFPIYHPEWGADEEILLLEAIDMYGPGNWGAVAEHVGNKSAAACKAHYHEIYIHVETYPLPKPSPAMQHFDPSVLPKQQQEQQHKMVQDTQAAGAAVAQARKKENSWAELNRQEEAQIAASMPSISAQRPSKKSRTSTAPAPAATPVQPLEPAPLGPSNLKQEVKEEKPSLSTLQNVKVEQKEGEAEEEGTATAGAAAPVAMDVDSMHLEGEHLTQGQKAAAQGMKHVAHAKAASKKEPKTEDQTHQTAATGRTLHGDNAAPATPPSKANPEGSQGPPDQAAQQGGDAAGAAEAPLGGAAPAHKSVVAASGQDPKASGFDVTGYHAKRREFDPEYDNDAECVIADMEFTDADTEEDRQLKLRMLEIYNKRLDEREARHDFLAEHGLLNMRKVQALDRRRTGPERDTHAKLRVFARYSAPAEHDNLVEGLLLEQRLRSRIEELKENRRQGARTMADAEAMESDRKQKAKGQAQPSTAKHAAGSAWPSLAPLGLTPLPGPTPFPIAPGPYFPTATPQRNFADNLPAPSTLPLPLFSPLPPNTAAAPPAGPAALTGASQPLGNAALTAPGSVQPSGNAAAPAATPQGPEALAAQSLGLPAAGARLQGILAGAPAAAAAHTAEGAVGGLGPQGAVSLPSGVHATAKGARGSSSGGWGGGTRGSRELGPPPSATAPPPGNKGAGAALASWRTRRGVALDISCMPGVELLGVRERELCATSRLHPAHYLALKDMMLRDCARHGTISRQEARTFFRLDASRSLRLYDLWVQLGWVSAPAAQKKATSGGAGEAGITAASAAARVASEDGDFEETI